MRIASDLLTLACLIGVVGFTYSDLLTAPGPERSAPSASTEVEEASVDADAAGLETATASDREDEEAEAQDQEPVASAIIDGLLCGDARLVGRALESLNDENDPRCGTEAPIALTAIAGVSVSPEIATDCALATQLADWIELDIAPDVAERFETPLAEIVQVSGYVCRNRNGQANGRLSEHALARAIDIARFRLADDQVIVVESGWVDEAEQAAFLRSAWESACGRFGTVLGPDSDEWHRDHFHLDAAERRQSYCR